jgi:dihydroorotate dehydrogenase
MRKLLWNIAKWLLFRLDAETAHLITVRLLRLGIRIGGAPLRIASGGSREVKSGGARVFDLEFRSRLGLAAGFDKNCEILRGLPDLGFGFAELGTVTPRPQPGNDRPRLFRDVERGAIFNRMGFNSLGSELVSRRLAVERESLPSTFRVGVNVGKNKDTPSEEAAQDYLRAARAFRDLSDYLVINVSSPNTPGLRQLQSAELLRPIVHGVAEEIMKWSKKPPLLLKIAPELDSGALHDLIGEVERWGCVDGWVLTNTLAGEHRAPSGTQSGGWSGAILTERARSSLESAVRVSRLPIISVGGIMDAAEASRRLELGAALVQIYSGWILNGPAFPVAISRALEKH